ncbi:MAG: outer membrane protein transport protein [Hyphomicrobiales bacterium]
MVFLRNEFFKSFWSTKAVSYIYSCSFCLLLSSILTTNFYPSVAKAGGFAIREQSTLGLGAAFAGIAAGDELSSIYWNSAAVASAGKGLTTESHYAVIVPSVTIDPDEGLFGGLLSTNATDIGKTALVPASYGSWRINDKLVLGYGFNAPFGLSTEPDDRGYAGQFDARKAALKTLNFNPVLGYQISPTLNVGVGFQVMYSELKIKQATTLGFLPPSATNPSSNLKGDDWSYGFTAGFLWKPVKGTSLGVGYRSRMETTLEGDLNVDGFPTLSRGIKAEGFDLPDMVTVSFRQDLSDNLRLLGTFEWSNWSVLQVVTVTDSTTGAFVSSFSPKWDDGYFFSAGLEYDYNSKLTLRTGVAYEQSPIQEASQRLLSIPDTDRVWLSAGATYKWSEQTSFDIAYTHIFGDDSPISSESSFTGEVEADVDIIGVSMKTKWGADGPFGLLKGLSR